MATGPRARSQTPPSQQRTRGSRPVSPYWVIVNELALQKFEIVATVAMDLLMILLVDAAAAGLLKIALLAGLDPGSSFELNVIRVVAGWGSVLSTIVILVFDLLKRIHRSWRSIGNDARK
jgi:hypothetical protein